MILGHPCKMHLNGALHISNDLVVGFACRYATR